MQKEIQYDIYIDEDKVNKTLGFLVVKNSPYIQQILYNKRQKFGIYNELHFKSMNNSFTKLAVSWINLFCNFQDIYDLKEEFCFFKTKSWDKKIDNKKEIIINFINNLKTKNIVAFMDFDTEHKKINIENTIKKETNILRVYHLDSKATDLLQLVDILLWANTRWTKWKLSDDKYFKFSRKLKEKKNLSKWEIKSYLWTYYMKKMG